MRLFFEKLGLLFSSVLSVILLSVPTTPIVDNIDNNNIKDDNAIQEKVITENEVIESNQEELQKETKIEKQEIVDEKKENDTSTTSNKSITNNVNKETNVNTKQETNTTTSASSNVKVHEESQKQEINNNVNQYIGVPNPNDFYYSFHHGKIEYSSMDSCLEDVPNIAFKDTTDIINTWCIDVVDGQGTILGQYLYINCSSGNCDKYK